MTDHPPGFFLGTEMPTAGWWEALWPDPAGVLAAVGLRPGMGVIDLCSGDGWFTLQIAMYTLFLFCIADGKKQNLASFRKTVRVFVINNRPVAELLPVQKWPSKRMDKMIAARVMETYTSLFLTPKQDDGSRYSVIARIGDFEVRLLELPSVNSPEELILWVELYDGDLRVGVDSCKCSDLDEAIGAAQFLTAQARQQSRGMSGILLRAITSESIAA